MFDLKMLIIFTKNIKRKDSKINYNTSSNWLYFVKISINYDLNCFDFIIFGLYNLIWNIKLKLNINIIDAIQLNS